MKSGLLWLVSGVVALAAVGAATQPAVGRHAQSGARYPEPVEGAGAIVPYKIHVTDAALEDLKGRLARARFADEIPGAGWGVYGTNLAYLRELIAYWRETFDWRAQERRLNRFEQFRTNIDGLNIHFIHQRSAVAGATPLLLLNGWPSSIVEYTKVIESLTDPVAHGGQRADAFDVVIPSMPGYGFSDKPRERGYNQERIAALWATLMARLGYTRYVVQGADWGVSVGTYLALHDAAHVAALHLTSCPGAAAPAPASTAAQAPRTVSANGGYQEIQSTKPETLGNGLSDSPVGLASWILDKWWSWSDHDGDLEKVYTKDEILSNVAIYWFTNSGASSARLYYESRHVDGRLLPSFGDGFLPQLPQGHVNVPTGCGTFPSQFDRRGTPLSTEVSAARTTASARYNVVHFTIMPRGGHFPALEQPTLWIEDLRAFARGQRS